MFHTYGLRVLKTCQIQDGWDHATHDGQQISSGAQAYYTQGLTRQDYYSEGQDITGQWHGRAAAMLGLSGDVTEHAFAALT